MYVMMYCEYEDSNTMGEQKYAYALASRGTVLQT
jgi:hypothetical protein